MFLFLAGLACALPGGGSSAAKTATTAPTVELLVPTSEVVNTPTEMLLPTLNPSAPTEIVETPTEAPTEGPTITPTPSTFIDDFATDTWGDPKAVTNPPPQYTKIYVEDNHLFFQINDQSTYIYKFAPPSFGPNVTVEVTTENFGQLLNNVALVCRASDLGWYEFRVSNSRTIEVYRYDPSLKAQYKNPYRAIRSRSPSDAILNTQPNKIKISCNGADLSLTINGKSVWSGQDKTLTEGDKIGLGAMSEVTLPIKVSFTHVVVEKP
jgi:hypothetical protein